MDVSSELIMGFMGLNAAGWTLALGLGKKQFSDMGAKLEAMGDKINGMVTRSECQGIHNRIHNRVDEVDTKSDSQGERIARLEVAAGK